MQDDSVEYRRSQEVDIQEIFQALSERKLLIILLTIFSVVCAAAFAFLSKPVYEARGYVVPPGQNEIANFNYGRTAETHLAPYTVKDVYGVFIGYLQGESLRQEFFNEVYLPSLSESERGKSEDVLYGEFNKKLTVALSGKETSDRYAVVAQNGDPVQAVEWVKKYISKASDLAKKELLTNVSREAEVWARNLERQITASRTNSEKTREDTIIKLREALRVAEAIGLEKPPIITGNPSVEVAGSMNGQIVYMRGTKALKAEIENLESRKSDDPFIYNLRDMQTMLDFYKGLEVKAASVSVYRIDGGIDQPQTPVKPMKALLIILGLMIGLIVSSVYVVVSHLLRRGKAAAY